MNICILDKFHIIHRPNKMPWQRCVWRGICSLPSSQFFPPKGKIQWQSWSPFTLGTHVPSFLHGTGTQGVLAAEIKQPSWKHCTEDWQELAYFRMKLSFIPFFQFYSNMNTRKRKLLFLKGSESNSSESRMFYLIFTMKSIKGYKNVSKWFLFLDCVYMVPATALIPWAQLLCSWEVWSTTYYLQSQAWRSSLRTSRGHQ